MRHYTIYKHDIKILPLYFTKLKMDFIAENTVVIYLCASGVHKVLTSLFSKCRRRRVSFLHTRLRRHAGVSHSAQTPKSDDP